MLELAGMYIDSYYNCIPYVQKLSRDMEEYKKGLNFGRWKLHKIGHTEENIHEIKGQTMKNNQNEIQRRKNNFQKRT